MKKNLIIAVDRYWAAGVMAILFVALVVVPVIAQVAINREQGGKRMTVGSGGSLDIESGAEIDIESGGALKIAGTAIDADAAELNLLDTSVAGTIVASKAIVADSNGALADADLVLESTNEINVTIGGVGLLALDDAAIASNAGAADVAGQDAFIETQDGGADTAADGAVKGGDLSIKTGDAGAAAADQNGAAGGALTIEAGAGTAGGAHSSNNPNGGDGADITLTPGGAGAAGGGTGVAGNPGKVKVSAGVLAFANSQSIGMGGTQVVLTLNPGTPTGTLITSNVIFIDADGTGDDLLLPPEADADGLVLFIYNTGGETITIKEDGDSVTIATVQTTEHAIVACDGTSWKGLVGAET